MKGIDWMGWPLAIAVTAVLLAGMVLAPLALADDASPQTELRICGGTLPATSLLSNHWAWPMEGRRR